MRSPRFDIRAKKLRAIFSPDNIEKIWKDKVKVSMRDQFMCDGIENFDFHVSRKVESQKLSHLILSGDYVPQKAQRILVEKSKGGPNGWKQPLFQAGNQRICTRFNAPGEISFWEARKDFLIDNL